MQRRSLPGCAVLLVVLVRGTFGAEPTTPDYDRQIAPIFKKYCNGCHSSELPEGELALDDFAVLMRGGANGAVVVPGDADKSRLILAIEKKAEPFMPPKGNEGPTAAEIELLKAWIKAGAAGPKGERPAPVLVTPKIAPKGEVRKPISALACSPDGKWIAVARYGAVEILETADGASGKPIKTLDGHTGNVNDVGFSRDGRLLYVAAGEAGLFGEATLWETADWKRLRTIKGHKDSLYAADLSPDGRLLATGGYDQKIRLWDAATGKALRQLDGHNGAVFDLAFHPDGRLLASASGDRTVKIWSVATGERLDTLVEPEKEQYALAFTPDGRHLAAGGADNRIRIWRISQSGREGTNPIAWSRFAHEAAIVRLAFAPDGGVLVSSGEDRAIKLWETNEFTQLRAMKDQPDWVSALAVVPDSSTLIAGRMDGSLARYSLNGGRGGIEMPRPIARVPLPRPHTGPAPDKPATIAEAEPNDALEQATPLPVPGTATGVLMARSQRSEVRGQQSAGSFSREPTASAATTHHPPFTAHQPDADLYRFTAKVGQTWVIETNAARSKSPADTRIEVLHPDGRPVLRYLLRAVRESYVTFRPIDSRQNQVRVKNWEEMDLNQFMYMGGEVCKLFRMPQGPDSAFVFYTVNGQRRCYFDTSATIHAKEDPVYIVEPYPPGTELVDNGLPVFPLDYANDDDGGRKLGSDSRLTFTAPADGDYLVRVTDVRGFGGQEYKYSLTIREPRPDFNVSLAGKGATIGAGSGQRLTVKLDRIDDFEDEVRVEITGLPAGFSATSPIVIQAGHLEAQGVINVNPDVVPNAIEPDPKRTGPVAAPRPIDWSQVKVTATATIHDKTVTKDLGGIGTVKVAKRPSVIVNLEPDPNAGPAGGGPDLVMAPGTTITAMLRIERSGYDGELKFDVDNLPHGVIVDNIGLNGIMIRAGETERQIFLTAADWVPETTRPIHATALAQGNQASRPILLHVRHPGRKDTSAKGNSER